MPATWQPHLLTCYTDSENQSDRMEHTEGEMGKLYFVRHGQTFWNVDNKICGATDIALTPLGHEQAILTGAERPTSR